MGIEQDPSHPTGVSGDRTAALYTARNRKAEAALEMRHRHIGWDEIAETLGYPTPRHALVAVEKALQNGLRTDESKQFMRELASKKLEELIYAVWAKATNDEHPEQLTAVGKARELIADHAKLHGYVAPTEVSIYNPSQREIDDFVGELMKERVPQLEQGDIFEMEENDEGVFEKLPSMDDF
jgi:hypothetical protein